MEGTPFVLASTRHGAVIVNRLDYAEDRQGHRYGVGYQLLTQGVYEPELIEAIGVILRGLRETRGDGVVALDIGANIGIVTVEMATALRGWGEVLSFEPQKHTFYALAGNIVLANCFNATAAQVVVSDHEGVVGIPYLDPREPASFGSLEIEPARHSEGFGQTKTPEAGDMVTAVTVDGLGLPRCDFLKIDVEGMETKVIAGGRQTIGRFHPILIVEAIKTDQDRLVAMLDELGYVRGTFRMDILAVHRDDPLLPRLITMP